MRNAIHGWKIHISPRPQYWIEILKAFYRVKEENSYISCKILHMSTNSKIIDKFGSSPENQLSKFITIYPHSDDEAKNIVNLIQEEFKRSNITPDMFTTISSELQIAPGIFTRYSIYDGTKPSDND